MASITSKLAPDALAADQILPPVPEGLALEGSAALTRIKVLAVLWGQRDEDLPALLDGFVRWQLVRRDFKPIFVTDSLNAQAFTQRGFLVEHIPSQTIWTAYEGNRPHGWLEYIDDRLRSVAAAYRPNGILFAGERSLEHALADGVLGLFAVLSEQQLDGGAGDVEDLRAEVEALSKSRDQQKRKKWRSQWRTAELEQRVLELEEELAAVRSGTTSDPDNPADG